MDDCQEGCTEHATCAPWATWPWQKCSARTIDEYGRCRCEMRQGHRGRHRAERGMYDVLWGDEQQLAHH